jgi:hypothetical protein
MKAVIGVFDEKDKIKTAVTRLKEAGFAESDLGLITGYQVEEVDDLLDQEPEETAVTGAVIGSGIGGVLGLLGGITVLTVPGVGPMLASGLLATATGSVVGGYLGSLYASRKEDQPEHELKKALSERKLILFARVQDMNEESARTIMQQSGGNYLETHKVSPEATVELSGTQ